MAHLTAAKIQEALDSGLPVYSHALGRVGRIRSIYDDGFVVIERKGSVVPGVTRFDRGDHVRLVERNDSLIIENDIEAHIEGANTNV